MDMKSINPSATFLDGACTNMGGGVKLKSADQWLGMQDVKNSENY